MWVMYLIVAQLVALPALWSQTRTVTGDFNGDGIDDQAILQDCGEVTDELVIQLGKSGGGFTQGATISATVYDPPRGCEGDAFFAADLNKNGKLDLVVLHFNGTGLIFPGNGDGTFKPGVGIGWGAGGGVAAAVGDFNGDGKPDIIVATGGVFTGASGRILLLINQGNDVFLPSVFDFSLILPYSNTGYVVTLGDFNGDGKLDLRATGSDGNVVTLLGNGDGTFTH
jgi:hypothetical protein